MSVPFLILLLIPLSPPGHMLVFSLILKAQSSLGLTRKQLGSPGLPRLCSLALHRSSSERPLAQLVYKKASTLSVMITVLPVHLIEVMRVYNAIKPVSEKSDHDSWK